MSRAIAAVFEGLGAHGTRRDGKMMNGEMRFVDGLSGEPKKRMATVNRIEIRCRSLVEEVVFATPLEKLADDLLRLGFNSESSLNISPASRMMRPKRKPDKQHKSLNCWDSQSCFSSFLFFSPPSCFPPFDLKVGDVAQSLIVLKQGSESDEGTGSFLRKVQGP